MKQQERALLRADRRSINDVNCEWLATPGASHDSNVVG